MRTQEQIAERVRNRTDYDPLGFTHEVIASWLTGQQAHDLGVISASFTAEEWDRDSYPYTRGNVLREMRDYAALAWEKVEYHRAISAERTIIKMQAWMWLLGDDEGISGSEEQEYANYGAPQLAWICERYDFPIPEKDAINRMRRSEMCRPECRGCAGAYIE